MSTSRTAAAHTLVHAGHAFEVVAGRDHVVFRVDGRIVAERDFEPVRTQIDLAEVDTGLDLDALDLARGRVVVLGLRGRIRRCALVIPPAGSADAPALPPGLGGPRLRPRPERLSFEPPAGSAAHRLYRFERDHPTLYAVRHVVVALVQVALLLVGLRLAIDLLPWGRIPWPHLHLPRPNLPSLPLPHIELPDITLPGWVKAVLESKKYWFPVLVAILVASGEAKRRAKRRAADAAPSA